MPNGIDFGRTAADYSTHRAGFPGVLYERLAPYGVPRPGERVLDLGTGTGSLARGLAHRGAVVSAIDIAAPLLEEAARLAQAEGLSVDFRVSPAEAPPFPPGTFDGVSAGQCWHWFDRPRVAAKCRELLHPGGWLLLAHFDWLPLSGNVVEETEALIQRFNPAWAFGGGSGLHPAWLRDLAGAGFVALESFSTDVAVPYTHAAWRGRIRASAGVAASLPAAEVERFDTELAHTLTARFPEQPLQVPHRVWALVARAP